MGSRRRITFALIALVALVVVGWLVKDTTGDGSTAPAPAPQASSATPGPNGAPGAGAVPGVESGLPVRPLSALPPEAAATWQLILRGGPFPSNRDGAVFENREKRLPREQDGYYREYTVPTPGSDDRGARRLVHGSAGELYYTGDHYVTFVLVEPGR